ncbi:hypothetical protein [Methanobrevibacter sp.]|uniref:DUF11 domain-containing protein n=1 Tax=Methanobrevibacter sp. TaxID=66852 RepID=UPI00388CFB35
MLENKIAISKNFLIAICFISFVLFAVNTVNAIELNDTPNNINMVGSEVNDGINAIDLDKLGNSQEDVLSQSNTVTLNNGKFSDIQNLINNDLNDGDTLVLNGVFTTDTSESHILVYKNITFTSTSTATFDAKHLTGIFVVENGGSGSSFSNFIFKNAYASYGSAIYIFGKDVVIERCLFQDNYASMGGGAIYTNYYIDQNPDYGRNLMIKDCGFMNNGAKITAGAVGAYGYNVKILNCLFDSNSVYDSDGGEVYGGALQIGREEYVVNSVVKNCKFIRNKAISRSGSQLSHGGASCIRDGVTFENCLFEENSADHGGALTTHCSATIKNCTFKSNTANKYGGAISNMDKINSQNLRIIDCDFSSNSAPYGGAVKLAGYSVAIDDCNFDDNYASIDGGAVYIDTNTLDVTNSNFNYNDAEHNGGAVYVNGKSTNIKESYFRHNTAIANPNVKNDGLGGAIYINGTLDTINNNIFEYNVARNGSAIYYDKSGKDLKITNNVMSKNQAWVYALPIYARDIYYGETERIGAIIYGGNNIGDYDNLAVSNAIYNAAPNRYIKVNGETPVYGATNSGQLYQDAREYNIDVLLTVKHSDGTVVYNKTLKSSYLGEVSDVLSNLKVGTYTVTAKHFEDNYYKAITNQTTFVVKSQVDVAVSKDTNYETYNYHDQVVWTINVVNNGPNDATGVKVNDVLPSGLVYQSYSASVGTYSNGVWNIGNLAKGASATLKITTLINKTGDIINTANIVANEFDWNTTNNKDSQKVTIPKAADLSITKQSNVTNANLGDFVKWTLTVRNNGPDVDTNVVVSDILPAGLIFKNSNGNYADGKWSVGTLNVGQSKSLEIITLVNTTGSIINTATVTGEKHDYNLANNKASKSINVAKAADLKISKSVNNTSPAFGSLVKWTLTVTNLGPDAASGVKVSDVLPVGLVYQSYSASVGSYAGGIWSVGNLAKGAFATLNIVCMVNRTGSIKNIASVTGNEFDINKNNNRAESLINVPKASDLAIVKQSNVSNPNYGDLVKWTLTVRNNGPDNATEVTVGDVIPQGLVFVSSNGSYVNGVWSVGTLNVGQSRSLEIITLVNITGNIINKANVTGKEYDPNPSNNNASKSIYVPKAADLSINKVVNVSNPNYLNLVKWTLTVRNIGPDSATNVTVSDILPVGLIYQSYSASVGSYIDGRWYIGNLAKGGSETLNIVCRVNKTGSIMNVASVTATEYDINKTNNKDEESIDVPKAADLEIKKLVNNSSPNYHQYVKWSLIVKNNGPDDAHGVFVEDILPDGLIAMAANGNYDGKKWNIGTLNAFSSKTLEITTLVNKTGLLINNANVFADEYDYNESNNNDNASINVPPSSDLEISKIVNTPTPLYNENIKWIIIVKNNGPDKATDVRVEELLPDAFELVRSTASKGYYINGIWSIGDLNIGEIVNLEIITKVVKTGNFTNKVNVTSNEYDYNKSNNEANKSIKVYPAIDLEITKKVNNTSPNYYDLVKWSITVRNNGPDNATQIEIIDILPKGLELVSYNSSKGFYSDGFWKFCCLNVGETQTLDIITRIKAIGEIKNVVTANANEYDYDSHNNRDESVIIVAPSSDLEVTKYANQSVVNYKDLVKWTLVVKNNGPSDATRVFVLDSLPEGLTFISAQGDGSYSTVGTWYVGNIASGQTRELTIVSRADKTGEFNNVAVVRSDQYDYNPSNDRAEKTVIVPPAADLAITKTVSKLQYAVGDLISYAIEITNNGPDMAKDINVSEIKDDALEFKSVFAASGVYDNVNDIWHIESLSNGEKASLYIDAISTKEGLISNKVSVISKTFDYNMLNNYAESIVEIIKKIIDPNNPFNPGTYSRVRANEFEIGDLGNIAKANIEMRETGLPVGLLFVIALISLAFCGSNISKKR